MFRARVLAQEDLPVAPVDTTLRGAARGEAISAYFMRAAEGRRVTVEVLRVWKGALGARAEVYTPRECCICGFEFADGGEYLIYAYASGRRPDGRLRTFLCTRTRAIARAAADLEALGPGTPPAGGAPADSASRPPGE